MRPEVTIPGYGGLRVELPSIAVTDDEVDAEIAAELKRFGTLSDLDRPAAVGDYVVVDLAGTRDGEPVPGLNADDWSYEIGQGWVSDDFDEQLVGVTPGDERSFTTTPKGTVRAGRRDDQGVAGPGAGALRSSTDEWVADNIGEFDTVAEWTDSIRSRLAEPSCTARGAS